MLDRISTKFGQNDQLVSGSKSYALFDLKGYVGGHRGQKCHFLQKNVTPPSCFIGFLRHLIRMTSE